MLSFVQRQVFTALAQVDKQLTLIGLQVFDPVVAQVLKLIEDQLSKCAQKIDALLLVGGFSGSEYLFKRVDVSHGFLFSLSPVLPCLLFFCDNVVD